MVVYTDNKPFFYLFCSPLLNLHQIRGVEKLVEFYLDIYYIAGPTNIVADGLSQPPITTKSHLGPDPTVY